MKKHQEELGDIIKLHDEEKYKLKQQLEDARLNYIKEIENVYSYVVLSFFFFVYFNSKHRQDLHTLFVI